MNNKVLVSLSEVSKPSLIVKIIKEIEPQFEEIVGETISNSNILNTENNDFDADYSAVISILLSLEKFFENHNEKRSINFTKLDINQIKPAELLSSDIKKDNVLFCEILLVMMYLSPYKEQFLDMIGKLPDDNITYFLDVVESYINSNDKTHRSEKNNYQTENLNTLLDVLNKTHPEGDILTTDENNLHNNEVGYVDTLNTIEDQDHRNHGNPQQNNNNLHLIRLQTEIKVEMNESFGDSSSNFNSKKNLVKIEKKDGTSNANSKNTTNNFYNLKGRKENKNKSAKSINSSKLYVFNLILI